MEGFKKIHFGQSKPAPTRAYVSRKMRIPRIFLFAILSTLFLVTVGIIIIIFPMRAIYKEAQSTAQVAKEAYSSAKNQDLEGSKVKFSALKESLQGTQNSLQGIKWLGAIPLLGAYERDGEHLVQAAIDGVEAAIITIDTLVPYADLLGLKGESTFVSGSADDRIKTAVETLDKIIPSVDGIATKIKAAENELSQIDPEQYPKKIGAVEIQERLSK